MKETDTSAESGEPMFRVPAPVRRAAQPDVYAPDGSEIRLLADAGNGASKSSMVEVALPAGQVSRPVYHRTVEETWYILEGARAGVAVPAGARCRIGVAGRRVAGGRAGDPDGLALPVRCGSRRGAALLVPHNAAVAGGGRGRRCRVQRDGGADGLGRTLFGRRCGDPPLLSNRG